MALEVYVRESLDLKKIARENNELLRLETTAFYAKERLDNWQGDLVELEDMCRLLSFSTQKTRRGYRKTTCLNAMYCRRGDTEAVHHEYAPSNISACKRSHAPLNVSLQADGGFFP